MSRPLPGPGKWGADFHVIVATLPHYVPLFFPDEKNAQNKLFCAWRVMCVGKNQLLK